jgi:hypothetical protein
LQLLAEIVVTFSSALIRRAGLVAKMNGSVSPNMFARHQVRWTRICEIVAHLALAGGGTSWFI